MSAFIIFGIDTDCGKTHATGLLARSLAQHGDTMTQKWVQTGTKTPIDWLTHQCIIRHLTPNDTNFAKMHRLFLPIHCPYIFTKPASPHLSARLENRHIDIDMLINSTRTLQARHDFVLIEGAGGVCVPLNSDITQLDLAKMLNLPVILVTSARLGSINHSVLSIQMLLQHGVHLHTLAFNPYFDDDKDICQDTRSYLQRYIAMHSPRTQWLMLDDTICTQGLIAPD